MRGPAGAEPVRVLVVHDQAEARYAVRDILGQVGSFLVFEAGSGDEAMRRALEDLPGLIVLDLNLPGLSGFEVLDRLKADARCRDIPVIIHTSRALDEDERRSLSGRVATVLDKCVASREEAASGLLRALAQIDLVPRIHPAPES
jgi:CheY-like chemotaxis protein